MERKLAGYKKKRNFSKTPEPKGDEIKMEEKNPVFVVQKHAATHLHYDFRLEIEGVLKSWAIPKGPSTDPKDKRLAVLTEDHPLAYKDFAGIIPEGQYGAGSVEIWDNGTYENMESSTMVESFAKGRIKIKLHGKKLKGVYGLIKMQKFIVQGKEESWLLMRLKD